MYRRGGVGLASDNLVSLTDRTSEEKSKIATMGGIASGEARRKKKIMRDTLEMLLDEQEPKTGKTYRELVTLGLFKGAIKGNAMNYKAIVETLGELNMPEGEKQNGVLIDLVEALNNAKKD